MNKIYLDHNDKIKFRTLLFNIFNQIPETEEEGTLKFKKKPCLKINTFLNIFFPNVITNLVYDYLVYDFCINYKIQFDWINRQPRSQYYVKWSIILFTTDGNPIFNEIHIGYMLNILAKYTDYTDDNKHINPYLMSMKYLLFNKCDINIFEELYKEYNYDYENIGLFNNFINKYYNKLKYINPLFDDSNCLNDVEYTFLDGYYLTNDFYQGTPIKLKVLKPKELKNIIVIMKIIIDCVSKTANKVLEYKLKKINETY